MTPRKRFTLQPARQKPAKTQPAEWQAKIAEDERRVLAERIGAFPTDVIAELERQGAAIDAADSQRAREDAVARYNKTFRAAMDGAHATGLQRDLDL
jgi:hypothetical protein